METHGDVTTEPSQRRTAMQTSGVFRLFFVTCLGTRGDYRSAEGVSTTHLRAKEGGGRLAAARPHRSTRTDRPTGSVLEGERRADLQDPWKHDTEIGRAS